MRLTLIFNQSQFSRNRAGLGLKHGPNLGREPQRVNFNFNQLHRSHPQAVRVVRPLFACLISPHKDKVTLSLPGRYMSDAASQKSIWFPEWIAALAALRLKELERASYRRALTAYLRFCKESRQ